MILAITSTFTQFNKRVIYSPSANINVVNTYFCNLPLKYCIYLLNYIPRSANINIRNFDHVIVEYNIETYDIQCWLCHPYIHDALKLCRFTKDENINVGNIPWQLLFRETVFILWKYNIEYWPLLPNLLNSMNGLHIHHLLT